MVGFDVLILYGCWFLLLWFVKEDSGNIQSFEGGHHAGQVCFDYFVPGGWSCLCYGVGEATTRAFSLQLLFGSLKRNVAM